MQWQFKWRIDKKWQHRSDRIKDRARTIGTHHQRFTRIWSGEVEERNDEGHDINNGQSRSVWRDHIRPSNRRGEEEHHRLQMGSPKQRRWSKVTHRWHRIWWSHQGRRWRLCINTTLCNPQGRPMHCISKIWSIRVGDISTAFLHAPRSNNKHPTKTTSRVLHQQEHLLETEEGDVWSQVITKSLGKTIWQASWENWATYDSHQSPMCKSIQKERHTSWSLSTICFL